MNLAPPQNTARVQLNDPAIKLFQLKQGQTLTVPETVDVPAMPNNLMAAATKRRCTGGELYARFDDTGTTEPHDHLGVVLRPGDVVAVSAVSSSKATVTVNGIPVCVISATTVCGVLGFFT